MCPKKCTVKHMYVYFTCIHICKTVVSPIYCIEALIKTKQMRMRMNMKMGMKTFLLIVSWPGGKKNTVLVVALTHKCTIDSSSDWPSSAATPEKPIRIYRHS